jgi:hypothetical protein
MSDSEDTKEDEEYDDCGRKIRRKCSRCKSFRLVEVSVPVGPSKDFDSYWGMRLSMSRNMEFDDSAKKTIESDKSIPYEFGIGFIGLCEFVYCLHCGQIQGDWPKAKTELDSLRFCDTCIGSGKIKIGDDVQLYICNKCDGAGEAKET